MAEEKGRSFSGIVTKLGLSPLEAPTKISAQDGRMCIGIPKEIAFQEHRIGLTPQSVAVLIANGHRVVIEQGAGEDAKFSDNDFSEAGAEIAPDYRKVYEADLIVKIAPPTVKELERFKLGQTLISPIHLPTITKEYLQCLIDKKITALAFEYIRDKAKHFPFVRSMSEIAGNSAVMIAAYYLSSTSNGKGVMLGGVTGVPPAKVVILGAGIVGINAARAALGLGATVSVLDSNIYKLMRFQSSIGHPIYTSLISQELLLDQLKSCDVAIGAIHSRNGRTGVIVPEEIVAEMKPGSVIVDVSIDQGGCFETSKLTSHDDPTFKEHDVVHYCVPNIPSRVSRTASYAISNILTQILIDCQEVGGMKNLMYDRPGIRAGVYVYKGSLTNQALGEMFGMKLKNLELLFAANM